MSDDSSTASVSNPVPSGGSTDGNRMSRPLRIARNLFIGISLFYLVSGLFGAILAGIEFMGPPPEAETPIVSPGSRIMGSLIVLALGVPGIFAILRRRSESLLGYLKIGGPVILLAHSLFAALSLEAPRGITVFLLLLAIAGMWITLVAYHPGTPAALRDWSDSKKS